MAAHSEEFASRDLKYQTCLILSSRLREANFSPKCPRTREETAEQTVCGGLNDTRDKKTHAMNKASQLH